MLSKIIVETLNFFFNYFSEKIRLGISCELYAMHMKGQDYFLRKIKDKIKMLRRPLFLWVSSFALFTVLSMFANLRDLLFSCKW